MKKDKIHTMVSNSIDKMLDSPEGQRYEKNVADATKKTILFIRNEIENNSPSDINWDKLMFDAYQLFGTEFMKNNVILNVNVDVETHKKEGSKITFN